MGEKRKPDFSGYATKAGLKCSDGRTIMPDAFKHQDTTTVPLVWQHGHSDAENILGHAILENRKDGVYAYGYFNDTKQAENAKTLVQHKDITALSIFANQLKEKAQNVLHGMIREVSLVLAGANPGALIDNITLAHSDGSLAVMDDEAVIYTGLEFEHSDLTAEKTEETIEHEDDGPTVQEVYDTMTDEQKEVVHYMVSEALDTTPSEGDTADGKTTSEDAAAHSDDTGKEVRRMSRNVFEEEQNKSGGSAEAKHVLTHDAMVGIVEDARKSGSFKHALEGYALEHGVGNIELLFPDARTVTQTPEWDKRRTEWVSSVLNGTRKTPFSRIKSIIADITYEAARARGYIKGNLKKEEWFDLTARTTTPATVYKKQKLDRDDIIDITDFDIVNWLWGEMRLMLDEELARAILIGDGRPVEDPANAGQPNPDKIKDPAGANSGAGVRSILNDSDLYAATINVNIDDANSSYNEVIDQVTRSLSAYKGSGNPVLYTTQVHLTEMLLLKDGMQRRLYRTKSELASELGVSDIIPVEVMETIPDLIGIIVNLSDYTIGTDKGGEIAKFDDFDINYNQYNYLLETRLSGALTKIRSAIIIKKVAAVNVLVAPTKPDFVPTTGVITIPSKTGVVYKRGDNGATVSAGAMTALAAGASLKIFAQPAANYYFADNVHDEWTFKRPTA